MHILQHYADFLNHNMINDLSISLNEKNKISYFKCITDIAAELTQITSKLNSNVNSVFECAKNNIKIINDAKKTTEEILGILESTQESFNVVRFNFTHSYHWWLSDVSSDNQTKTNNVESNLTCNLDTNQNETIIDLEDPNVSDVEIIEDSGTPDIQIVNEISYLNHRKAFHSNDNVQRDKQSDIVHLSLSQPNTSNKTNGELDICNDMVQDNHDKPSSLMDISFVAVVDNIEEFDKKKTNHHLPKLDTSGNDQTHENLNIECNQKNNLDEPELSSGNGDYVISKDTQIKEITDVPLASLGTEPSKSSSNQDYVILKKEQIQEITDVPFISNLSVKPSVYSDEKLRLRCYVQLDSSYEKNLKIFTNHKKRSKYMEDDAFLRLIDLSALEKQTSKRCYSSSDDSSSSTSSRSSSSVTKRKVKRRKVCSDDSDVTSFYESSNSDSECYENEKLDQSPSKKLDDNEEKALLLILNDSDTSESSDDSDVSTDNYEDQYDNSKTKRNPTKKISSDSKNSEKQKSSRSEWLNDELLRFKLPNEKNHVKRSLKDVDGNDIEITEPESSIESLSSTNSEEMESHSNDQESEDTKNDLQSSISMVTPNSKVTGRRNIRKVLDDQDITEITRLAVKGEENRIQRLAERKKQLNSLVRSEESLDENRLTLDVDFKTKKKLVEVDRGLVKLLKAHQKEGVRFMWDCCFESVEEVKAQKGSGCILAHCMGLGKTLQVITLVHTLLSNEDIGIKTIMIVCPMNTILNWVDEFDTWLEQVENKSNIKIVELTQVKGMSTRISKLENWQKNGGVLIISYDMLVSWTSFSNKVSLKQVKKLNNLLINPGADVVVCDEGHLLKNEASKRANRMQSVETQRRIILTGTPLQNNLNEYHCMVEFVKPHLLGSKPEFLNRFGNPINNGQFDNSTPHDVKLMKHRAHVLHRLLEGCVQRCDYAVLTPLLPPKQEYVISVRLSDLQTAMYQHFVNNIAQISKKQTYLFKNYQEIKRLVAHPKTMQLKMQRSKKPNNRDGKAKRNINDLQEPHQAADNNEAEDWWRDFVKEEDLEDMRISFKLVLLFGLLECCAKKQDKVLVFSQCLLTLDLIELFLKKFDGEWKRGLHYFRLDGTVDSKDRSKMCKEFNDPTNSRAKLFLISTRAGGLGINLTGANRVVVFDPSWNPSNDLQSIFRVFRFGQKKPCYIYRFLTAGTMEEKIYIRQVTKLSLSLRVLDEQQVGRHYRDTDLINLYKLEELPEAPILNRPKDDLLAEVFAKYGKYVYKFFEHDSLLENQEEEELDEEERKQAWLDYHQENLAQPNNNATAKPKPNQRKKLSEASVDSSSVSVTAAVPIDEITDLSDYSP